MMGFYEHKDWVSSVELVLSVLVSSNAMTIAYAYFSPTLNP